MIDCTSKNGQYAQIIAGFGSLEYLVCCSEELDDNARRRELPAGYGQEQMLFPYDVVKNGGYSPAIIENVGRQDLTLKNIVDGPFEIIDYPRARVYQFRAQLPNKRFLRI